MASMDGVGHPLSLKVMRVSRPSLAPHWQPFFSSSPSFSAHATSNPLSLQGSDPLEGNPKTLRDLSHAGQMLMLPAAFGSIQLGETFSCCLGVNNETVVNVDDVTVRVEMQTATSKVTLVEIGGTGNAIRSKDTLETVVHHEIKELGQHVLACTVTYRTPPGMRPATSGSENANDPFLQTFRKFYKFAVTNPLSVKTKVHTPRSPSALLSRRERDKVFLEVHIQNLTQGPLWFEKLRLEPVEGWDVVDANILTPPMKITDGQIASVFSGTTAIMHPQDVRQYVYIMTPKATSSSTSVPVPHAPGSIIPLGRLDISWRSSMGEPGRLLTSVLSRRIPLPPPSSAAAPASALPPYLQKSALSGQPARPQSPSVLQQQQRVATPPPQRPGSPLKRMSTPGITTRPGSPSLSHPPLPLLPGVAPARADIETDLVVLKAPDKSTVRIEQPFQLSFALSVSAIVPRPSGGVARRARVVTLAIQHLLPAPPQPPPPPPPRELKRWTSTMMSLDHTPMLSPRSGSVDAFTPRGILSPPGSSTPGGPNYITTPDKLMSPVVGSARNLPTFGVGGLAEKLKSVAIADGQHQDGIVAGSDAGEPFNDGIGAQPTVRFPLPYSTNVKEPDTICTGRTSFLGLSVTTLPPLKFTSTKTTTDLSSTITADTISVRAEETIEFSLNFIGQNTGFARIGGLRVLLISDREVEDEPDSVKDDTVTLHSQDYQPSLADARVLREWDVVAELWIT